MRHSYTVIKKDGVPRFLKLFDDFGIAYYPEGDVIVSTTQFPESVLLGTIGKSPLDIIQGHPDIDARYTADDRIVAARWYPDAEVTGFDVVRAR